MLFEMPSWACSQCGLLILLTLLQRLKAEDLHYTCRIKTNKYLDLLCCSFHSTTLTIHHTFVIWTRQFLLFLATMTSKFLASFVLLFTEWHQSQLFPATNRFQYQTLGAKYFTCTILSSSSCSNITCSLRQHFSSLNLSFCRSKLGLYWIWLFQIWLEPAWIGLDWAGFNVSTNTV